jgi:flagellar motility protein MotE (MotC chaperone)
MKNFMNAKFKSFMLWLVLTHILITAYCLVGAYLPFEFPFKITAAIAETKPAEAPHANSEAKPNAAEKAETEAADKGEKAKTPADAAKTSEQPPLMQAEDIRAIMDTLEKKRKSLQEDEARIRKERADLENIKMEIESKIAELTEVQKKIEDDFKQKTALALQQEKKLDDAELQKIKQLVKVYSSMKPKIAAAIVDKMDMNVVYQVFSNMKGEQVGEILSYVNQDRAAKISEWLATKEIKK